MKRKKKSNFVYYLKKQKKVEVQMINQPIDASKSTRIYEPI